MSVTNSAHHFCHQSSVFFTGKGFGHVFASVCRHRDETDLSNTAFLVDCNGFVCCWSYSAITLVKFVLRPVRHVFCRQEFAVASFVDNATTLSNLANGPLSVIQRDILIGTTWSQNSVCWFSNGLTVWRIMSGFPGDSWMDLRRSNP